MSSSSAAAVAAATSIYTSFSDQFPKSSHERERNLQRRKEQLLMTARLRYLKNLEKSKSELNLPTEQVEDSTELRRRINNNRDTSEL